MRKTWSWALASAAILAFSMWTAGARAAEGEGAPADPGAGKEKSKDNPRGDRRRPDGAKQGPGMPGKEGQPNGGKDAGAKKVSPEQQAKQEAEDFFRALMSREPAEISALLKTKKELAAKKNENGETGLHKIAQFQSRLEVAKVLLDAGTDAKAGDKWGATALHRAAIGSDNKAMIACLIENGADPNAVDEKGQTPLHKAARAGEMANVQILLEKGALASTKDKEGHTAADLATDPKCAALVALLRKKEAEEKASGVEPKEPPKDAKPAAGDSKPPEKNAGADKPKKEGGPEKRAGGDKPAREKPKKNPDGGEPNDNPF